MEQEKPCSNRIFKQNLLMLAEWIDKKKYTPVQIDRLELLEDHIQDFVFTQVNHLFERTSDAFQDIYDSYKESVDACIKEAEDVNL